MKKKILFVLILVLGLVTEVAKADFVFGAPTKLGPTVNTSSEEFNASISADGLSLYFISNRPGGVGGRDIWVATRATTDDDWGEPVNLGPTINTPAGEWGVSISYDGLSLYFDTRQSGTSSAINDLWVATRATTDDDWGNPVNLGPMVNSSGDDYTPSISSDGLALYFMSSRSGGYGNYDLWVTMRATTDEDWGAPVNLGPTVNSSVYDIDPGISPDGRMLFFTRTTDGTEANIWMTWRATTNDEWGEPINVGPTINSSAFERYPNISADGSTLFFRYSQSDFRIGGDIYQALIIPIVDFNGDEFVDTSDLLIMIDHWGTDDSICDIGPMPWGDGIVDIYDLEVFMRYWDQEAYDPTLIANWKLDETEGTIAYDSASENDGTLYGEPVWQPEGGMVDGALELDGIDDYIDTDPVAELTSGPFSIFAWIKGGAPGQTIISQVNSGNLMMADSSEGKLMTELASQRGVKTLVSDDVITDSDWHRVGLTWDGIEKILYVDDMEVVSKVCNAGISDNGLYIGAGKRLDAETFWSGLIDDVRIYNRAVTP